METCLATSLFVPLDLSLHHARLDAAEARLLSVLSHPVRVRLVHLLAHGTRGVDGLATSLGVAPAVLHAHIAALCRAGLVRPDAHRTTAGPRSYALADPRLGRALQMLRSLAADDGHTP